MKKAVFLNDGSSVGTVYSAETLAKLHEKLTFDTDDIIRSDKLDDYAEILADADYVFSTWGMPSLSGEQIDRYLPKLKAVFYAAGSVQAFAKPFIDRDVAVFSAWAANGVPVAEYTFAQITLASKGFFQRLHRREEGSAWSTRFACPVSFSGNYEITVGIIGAGMIGKMVIGRLKTLDRIRILVFDPFLPDDKAEELGVEKTDLITLFAESDVISNHLANNPQTVGIINKAHFSVMKPQAVFINTGRGAQIVEADMISALREVPTRAAVLDVTFPEPPEKDSPLYTMDNVFLTPHIAGSLGNEVHRMGEYMYEEFEAFDAEREVRYRVTAKMLETMA